MDVTQVVDVIIIRMATSARTILIVIAVITMANNCGRVGGVLQEDIVVPNLPGKVYYKDGDVLIGGMFPIQRPSDTSPCGTSLRNKGIIQYMEAMVYALEKIYNDNSLLPNISLGYSIVDTCVKESTALAQALKFVPRQQETNSTYKVAGVIGPMKSSNTIAVSTMLAQFNIPQVSYASSSDSLSDTVRFPNFFRTVPPDQYQVKTIIEILKHFNWTYISVLFTDDVYGLDAMKTITKLTKEVDICIGYQKSMSDWMADEDFDFTVRQLIRNKNAHAVIVFVGPDATKRLMEAIQRQKAEQMFTFIGSDAWASRVQQWTELVNISQGSFLVKPISIQIDEFQDYFVKLNLDNRQHNPWFDEFWRFQFRCQDSCPDNASLTKDNVHFMSSLAPIVDAVQALIRAIHYQTLQACPDGVTKDNFYDCYNGKEVINTLYRTDFTGEQGLVTFNDYGDFLGRFVVEQYQKMDNGHNSVKLAVWNALDDSITFNGEMYRFYDRRGDQTPNIPESVCSKECKMGEFKVQLELKCCWECRKCRPNEIVIENGTDCQACPLYYWPDDRYKVCELIEPTFITFRSVEGIGITAVAGTGMLATILTAAFYIKNNDKRLIKASSRELSYLMLLGIFLGYLTTIGFLFTPSDMWCKAVYAGFCLGFVWVYAPLLVKTNRILRIFNAGKKTKKTPKFIGSKIQMALAISLITIQVAVTACSLVLVPPEAELDQPSITNRFVELSCYLPSEGLIAFLAYNLLLVCMCTVHAIYTRNLPDNFNEARFIAMCVYATLITWISFVPTYFTTARPYFRILLLSTCLLLNDTLALMFLFWPKVYAVLFVGEDRQKITKTAKYVASQTTGTPARPTEQTVTNNGTKSEESKSEDSRNGI